MEKDELTEALTEALKNALTYDKPDRPALVARIPVICNDIRWIKWLLYTELAGIGYLITKALGI